MAPHTLNQKSAIGIKEASCLVVSEHESQTSPLLTAHHVAPPLQAGVFLTMNHPAVNRVVGDIIRSPEDKRVYRGLEFTNGLKAMLICDPTTDKSSAALDVQIGKKKSLSSLFSCQEVTCHYTFQGPFESSRANVCTMSDTWLQTAPVDVGGPGPRRSTASHHLPPCPVHGGHNISRRRTEPVAKCPPPRTLWHSMRCIEIMYLIIQCNS